MDSYVNRRRTRLLFMALWGLCSLKGRFITSATTTERRIRRSCSRAPPTSKAGAEILETKHRTARTELQGFGIGTSSGHQPASGGIARKASGYSVSCPLHRTVGIPSSRTGRPHSTSAGNLPRAGRGFAEAGWTSSSETFPNSELDRPSAAIPRRLHAAGHRASDHRHGLPDDLRDRPDVSNVSIGRRRRDRLELYGGPTCCWTQRRDRGHTPVRSSVSPTLSAPDVNGRQMSWPRRDFSNYAKRPSQGLKFHRCCCGRRPST